jgi:uncharacterized protein YbdZ (MbtH family)
MSVNEYNRRKCRSGNKCSSRPTPYSYLYILTRNPQQLSAYPSIAKVPLNWRRKKNEQEDAYHWTALLLREL